MIWQMEKQAPGSQALTSRRPTKTDQNRPNMARVFGRKNKDTATTVEWRHATSQLLVDYTISSNYP